MKNEPETLQSRDGGHTGLPIECPLGDVYSGACPSRAVLDLVANKWTLLVLPALSSGPMRNGELLRRINGISQKMLTQTLRELERNGLVRRTDHQEVPPRVEYEATDVGRSLSAPLRALDHWIEANFEDIVRAREAFDRAG